MMTDKPRVLSCLGCFSPGNDASGPNQSFLAFVRNLEKDYAFSVLSRDETGDAPKAWQDYKGVAVRQLIARRFGAEGLRKMLCETSYDVLLLNGFHDRELTIPTLMMRRLGMIPRKPTILSPRGEFSSGALSLKSNVKTAFRLGGQWAGLTRDLWLHATADHEYEDIVAARIPCRGVLMAPNLRIMPPVPQDRPRQDGPLRVAFVGRVTPVKNLHFALDVLAGVRVPVVYDIIGPIMDSAYWARCEQQIAALPDHITVRSVGALPHAEIQSRMTGYDAFFLPTLGENFGHAINEALSAGVPALIADTTPWTGLEALGAGWDIPLEAPERFAAAIEALDAQSPAARQAQRRAARRLAEDSFAQSGALEANQTMLSRVLQGG